MDLLRISLKLFKTGPCNLYEVLLPSITELASDQSFPLRCTYHAPLHHTVLSIYGEWRAAKTGKEMRSVDTSCVNSH